MSPLISRPLTLQKIRRIAIGISLLLLCGGIGYYLGFRRAAKEFSVSPMTIFDVVNRDVPPEHRAINFSLFWQVWDELEQSYLDPTKINAEKMVYGAISGMTSALGDPYTVFLSPQDNQQTKENLAGAFFGIGIQIGSRDHQLAVIAPIKSAPAQEAGIQSGDFILRITDSGKGIDRETQAMTLNEAVSLIRGDLGTNVVLRIARDGTDEPLDVSAQGKEILIPSVELTFLPVEGQEGRFVAHLRLTQFGERTKAEWDEAVTTILSRRAEVDGIVFDVRDNPGGFLSGAIQLASDFLKNGTVVMQQGRQGSQTYNAENGGRLVGIPVVMLVNGGSASASEIVAGALRDRLGVTLVGEKTFGKGTVQEAKDLTGGAGLHVTTSKWILPSGQEIADTGLAPDVEVAQVEEPEGEESVDEQLNKAIELVISDK